VNLSSPRGAQNDPNLRQRCTTDAVGDERIEAQLAYDRRSKLLFVRTVRVSTDLVVELERTRRHFVRADPRLPREDRAGDGENMHFLGRTHLGRSTIDA
jgi:hypothetical protein